MVKNREERLKDMKKRIKKLEENPFLDPSNLKINYLNNNEKDVKFEEAVKIIKGQKRVTASFLQKQLIIGYARAARLLNQLEEEGFIDPAEGIKPRKVINIK